MLPWDFRRLQLQRFRDKLALERDLRDKRWSYQFTTNRMLRQSRWRGHILQLGTGKKTMKVLSRYSGHFLICLGIGSRIPCAYQNLHILKSRNWPWGTCLYQKLVLHILRFCIPQILYFRSTYKWTRTVRTCVVQGSTVYVGGSNIIVELMGR